MRYSLLLFTVLFFQLTTNAQSLGVQDTVLLKIEHIQSIPGVFTDHFINTSSQVFTTTPTGQMRKYSLHDSVPLVYNELKKFGKPTSVDASNPLRTVVFFKPLGWITIMDGLLTQRNAFSLRKYGLFNIAAAVNSYDNQLWLFDSRTMQLLKIDESGNELLRTADLRNLNVDLPTAPLNLLEFEQMVILIDQTNGIYCFDRYGAFQNHFPKQQYTFAGYCKLGMLLRYKNLLQIFNPTKPPLKDFFFELPVEFESIENLKVCNDMISILKPTGIEIYKIK